MGVRHYKRFSTSSEARQVIYSPTPHDHNFEIHEWAVQISLNQISNNYTDVLGYFTLNDLLRLRRVVNRAIKVVKNPKKHNTKRHW